MRITGLLAACALVACGTSSNGDDESTAELTIEPASVDLTIVNGVPANQDYTATLTFPDGHTRDVTADTTFTVDAAFGSFQAAQVSIGTPGKTIAFGQYTDKVANGQIIAHLESTRVDPNLPPDTPDLFTAPEDPARAPTMVYPPENVVMPRNLGDFETHWTDGSGNNVFEVTLSTEFANVRVYVPGGNGVAAAGPMPSFVNFLAAEWASAVGVEPNVTVQIRGVDSANPTAVGATAPRLIRLTNETMDGGIYYWSPASTNGPEGIYRHDMANPGEPAEEYLTLNQTGNRCVGCHTLSRDGTQMAFTWDGGNGNGTTLDVAMAMPLPDTTAIKWNFATYTPDNSQLLTVYQGALTVRNAADHSVLGTMTAGGPISHPELSPDGTMLTYAREPGGSDWSFNSGQIFVRSYDQTTQTFGAEVPLVTDAGNNYYPSWSPDGQWIIYNHAAANSSYNNAQATLYAIKADGSAPAIELTAANNSINLTNSWGRWAPFQQTVGANGERLFWITVSSKRDFGVRLVGAQRPQIWMTPFFIDRAAAGQDPSAPAFRLPFQNIEGSNHIAQWTERVVATQ